jgi:hypothetical protein
MNLCDMPLHCCLQLGDIPHHGHTAKLFPLKGDVSGKRLQGEPRLRGRVLPMHEDPPRLICHGQGDDIWLLAHSLRDDGFQHRAVLGKDSIQGGCRQKGKGALALGLQISEQIPRLKGAHVFARQHADE